jgi:hypothetical protein
MYHFCTYFDHRYLPQGLALYQSLRDHCPSFTLWVLCLDDQCYATLLQLHLADVELIALEDFESGDEELLKAKANRTLVEYYFTCTPSLPLFVFKNNHDVDLITYLDADLYFFAGPAPLYREIGDCSVAIIAHRFPPYLRHFERHGVYNVGWLSFKRNENGLACLQWWRERCLEWCYDRPEDGRFADQKYLDDWPTRFQGVVVLSHKGANLAPWNLAGYIVHVSSDQVWVDDQPLIFFHYHGLRPILRGFLYDPAFRQYSYRAPSVVKKRIYAPYIRVLADLSRNVSSMTGAGKTGDALRSYRPTGLRNLLGRCWHTIAGDYLVAVNGRVV